MSILENSLPGVRGKTLIWNVNPFFDLMLNSVPKYPLLISFVYKRPEDRNMN